MNYYESIYILNPELSSEAAEKVKEVMSGIVLKQDGDIHIVDDWGVKRLAYNVKKHSKGHYVLMQFSGSAAALKELERNYRVNDGVIKYMTLRIDEKELQAVVPEENSSPSEAPQEETTTGE
jgi:small subunit ribosomal protein S6